MQIKPEKFTAPTGEKIEIRSAGPEDAESLCRHRLITSGETYFMARYPEECVFDIDKTRARLVETAAHPENFTVTAFVGKRVIGDLGLSTVREHMKYRHRSYMGISIQQRFCNAGLGGKMIETAVAQARENGFEQIELGVFEDNARAIHLYEKLGFQRFGIQPRAYKLKDGSYRDEIIMVRLL